MDRLLVVDAARRAEKFISKSLSGHSHHHFALRLPRYQTLVAADGLIERDPLRLSLTLDDAQRYPLRSKLVARTIQPNARPKTPLVPIARQQTTLSYCFHGFATMCYRWIAARSCR